MSAEREDVARLEGFADCEALVVAMLEGFQARIEAGHYPPGMSPKEAAVWAVTSMDFAVRLGQHRTDAYDQDEVAKAHRRAGISGLASKGGLARAAAQSPEARSEQGRKAVTARWDRARKDRNMAVNFDVSQESNDIITRIADRALTMARKLTGRKPSFTKLDIMMDVTAVHANGTPLRLAELLEADDANFSHDVFGIHRHLDRKSGSLGNHFFPRFAVPEHRLEQDLPK